MAGNNLRDICVWNRFENLLKKSRLSLIDISLMKKMFREEIGNLNVFSQFKSNLASPLTFFILIFHKLSTRVIFEGESPEERNTRILISNWSYSLVFHVLCSQEARFSSKQFTYLTRELVQHQNPNISIPKKVFIIVN